VGAAEEMGFGLRGTVRGRRELKTELAMMERKDMVDPTDEKKSIRKIGLDVGDSMKGGPIDRVKLSRRPVVDTAHVSHLQFLVGVGEGGPADMA
jgi:hypothetical protein